MGLIFLRFFKFICEKSCPRLDIGRLAGRLGQMDETRQVHHTKPKRGIRGRTPASAGGAFWDSLEEIPHAHADLVQSFFHAVVVPIFFLFFVLFLKLFWEGVVPPSGFLVFFFPDVVAVVNVKLVFFFKLCDAVFDCGFNFCNPKLKDYKPSRFMLPTCHYDAAKADRAVTFIENLRHTKGKWAGKRFWLLPWQEQIIRDVFGIVDERGNRQFRTAYVEIGKKNGKSELAAAVALYDYEEDFSFVRSDYRSGAGCLLVPHHPHRIHGREDQLWPDPGDHHPERQAQLLHSLCAEYADKQKIENEAAIAKAEADKQVAITNAEAEAQKTSIAADAQAEANRKLAESLSDTLIDYQKIQKWDGKLPTVSGGNALVSIDPAE